MNRRTIASGNRREVLRSRCGYTLLELLIASMLIAVLMAATWNLMTMYSGFLIAGRAQAVEQQLARSLKDLLATDLRAVVPGMDAPPHLSTSRSDPQLAPTDLRTAVQDRESDVADSFPRFESTGLVEEAAQLPMESFRGDEHSLTLIVTRSQPDFESVLTKNEGEGRLTSGDDDAAALDFDGHSSDDQLPSRPAAAEWMQVIYRFEPPRAVLREDQGLAPGLHRFEIPVESLGLLTQTDPSTETDTLVGDEFLEREAGFGDDPSSDLTRKLELLRERGFSGIAHEHLPEVVNCQFEYLGDAGWQALWEESFRHDRPLAVRIKVKLLSANEQRELMTLLGSDNSEEADGEAESAMELLYHQQTGTDPYAGFHPRLFERTILLAPQRNVRRPAESVTPRDERLLGSLGFLAGGRP